MGLLKIKNVGAESVVAKYKIVGAGLTGNITFILDGETIVHTYDASNKEATDVTKDVFGLMLNRGYIVGYKDTTDTAASEFRVYNLDRTRNDYPEIANAEITDNADVAHTGDAYYPIVHAHDAGHTYYIPGENIKRIVNTGTQVRLYFNPSSEMYLKFELNTIDTAQIDKYYGPIDSTVQSLTTTSFQEGSLIEIENYLQEKVLKLKGDKVETVDYDGKKFMVTYVSGAGS